MQERCENKRRCDRHSPVVIEQREQIDLISLATKKAFIIIVAASIERVCGGSNSDNTVVDLQWHFQVARDTCLMPARQPLVHGFHRHT
eukprot:SAG31_NODE_959_length_10757_cov_2.260086_2_plen_88_part_00